MAQGRAIYSRQFTVRSIIQILECDAISMRHNIRSPMFQQHGRRATRLRSTELAFLIGSNNSSKGLPEAAIRWNQHTGNYPNGRKQNMDGSCQIFQSKK